jgi:hypothetical protein
MRLSCSFAAPLQEIDEKNESLLSVAGDLEDAFLDRCAAAFPPEELGQIARCLRYAAALQTTDGEHAALGAYLTHPIRVATLLLRIMAPPQADLIRAALIHNVFEVCGVREEDLTLAGIPLRLAKGIRKLTIDRNLQFDDAYLARYYAGIEALGEDFALLKCIDKLDNFLGMRLFDSSAPHWKSYIESGYRHLLPMAERLSPDLSRFLTEVVVLLRERGSDPELVVRYGNFLARQSKAEGA